MPKDKADNPKAVAGDNSAHKFATDQLRAFIERVERLEEEKAVIATDIREVYAEAKAVGYDAKALRTIVKLRKQDPDKLAEERAILETYAHALGMGIFA